MNEWIGKGKYMYIYMDVGWINAYVYLFISYLYSQLLIKHALLIHPIVHNT